jgi:hypothetical protein
LKLSLKIAFGIFVATLLLSLSMSLWLIWGVGPVSRSLTRCLGTSAALMVAALFYVAAGDVMIRIEGNLRKPPSGPEH